MSGEDDHSRGVDSAREDALIRRDRDIGWCALNGGDQPESAAGLTADVRQMRSQGRLSGR